MMRLLQYCFFLFFVVFCGLPALCDENTQPLQRENFAYGMDLTVSGNHAIYGLNLPVAVYQGCTRADLGDLRVFNANHTVPHLLRAQVVQETERPAQTLPFFPLFSGGKGQNTSPPDLHISTNSQGTIIDIRQNTQRQYGQIITAYIIDTSSLEYPADWLEFTWEGQGENFSTSVSLASSHDLNIWSPQVSSSALAELRFGGHSLLRKRISVPQGIQRKNYLRLSWPAGKDGVQLVRVMAGYNREAQAHFRSMLALTGEALPVTEHGVLRFQYDSKGFFPVDQLKIQLPEQNSLSQIVVFSRADKEASWKRRAAFFAYRITVDGVNLDNGRVTINRTSDRYWRLELEANSGIQQAPTLELGWLPGQLVFMAQGESPYTLAYGRVGLSQALYPVDRLLQALDPQSEKKLVARAQAGAEKVLGGEERLVMTQGLSWRRWLLWGVLLSGVLIVGMMAFKLYRDMNGTQAPQDE
ncbi:MAG: DUF3999 domain-containing protein [Candidatus Electrothrix scaldis]|nr:MAG: DUF3999 domain-containing protein [Candidatus Electrothrix sp. GW3-3]